MKRTAILLFLCCMLLPLHSIAQSFGVQKELPVDLDVIKSELTFSEAWGVSPQKNFGKWRKQARARVLECLLTPPTAVDFDYRTIAVEQRDGYRAEKIELNISKGNRIPAYLLIPDGDGPFPAVAVLHDHGAKFTIGKEKNVRPFAGDTAKLSESEKWVEQCYEGIYTADFLARNGYVALAIDALFWGDRGRKEGSKYDTQQALSANLLQLGRSWCGVITYDDMRSVEFLATLPFVDPEAIGCVGFSMGAHRAWMLSAVTDRVKAAAAICWMNTTHTLMSPELKCKGHSAYSMIVPGLRNYLDYPHTASIACPKPMLFINGRYDKLFPVKGVQEAYDIMHQVWKSRKADDKLVTHFYDTPHTFNREMHDEVLRFLDKYLK